MKRLIKGLFAGAKPSFDSALRQYGVHNCCLSGDKLLLGMKPGPKGRVAFMKMPPAPRHICFMEALEQGALLQALLHGDAGQTVESLWIGTTSDTVHKRPGGGFDLSAHMALFDGATLPALTALDLGDMEMTFNGHPLYCRLGDLAPVLGAAPALETLDICGSFSLSAPVNHGHLQRLEVDVDDIAGTAGDVTAETFANLMRSQMPNLEILTLASEECEAFDLPSEFDLRAQFPKLRTIAIDPLTDAARVRLDPTAP